MYADLRVCVCSGVSKQYKVLQTQKDANTEQGLSLLTQPPPLSPPKTEYRAMLPSHTTPPPFPPLLCLWK